MKIFKRNNKGELIEYKSKSKYTVLYDSNRRVPMFAGDRDTMLEILKSKKDLLYIKEKSNFLFLYVESTDSRYPDVALLDFGLKSRDQGIIGKDILENFTSEMILQVIRFKDSLDCIDPEFKTDERYLRAELEYIL